MAKRGPETLSTLRGDLLSQRDVTDIARRTLGSGEEVLVVEREGALQVFTCRGGKVFESKATKKVKRHDRGNPIRLKIAILPSGEEIILSRREF